MRDRLKISGILGCDISPPFQYMEGLQSFFGIKKILNFEIMGPTKAKYINIKF